MGHSFSLAHLTVLDVAPPEMVALAARAGYDHVGVRLLPATPGGPAYLMDDPRLLRETLAAVADTGVTVFDLEIIRLEPHTDLAAFTPFLEIGQALGARAILVAGNDPDEARLTARFAGLCEAAAPYGLSADLEFMPWTDVPDLSKAARVVRAAAQPNGGVLVDALHFDRSGSRIADLAALPREWLHYVQLCDAPAEKPATTEGLIHAARAERLFPGEGGIDLLSILRPLPRDVPVSLEIPTDTLARSVGPEERARRALAAAKALLARLDEGAGQGEGERRGAERPLADAAR
ncbi:sugar phosphate isomerase/epimerase [Azospirillum agricola]|uniref:sugar phosphate isomerase/epimerase family protein n=1 Tax=Azospirillum agricola TaxID=1720247 RepID=UPI001AE40AF3|nr:sugar phosphate isomerase/epimerase [Azospirillum agricola]MBP2228746.1 sugar phosphate isomerase/epimerase [Azospirillum agricola]